MLIKLIVIAAFAVGAFAQEATKPNIPKPLSDTDARKMAIIRSKTLALEHQLRNLVEQHTAARQQLDKLNAEYNAAIAKLQKDSNATGCSINLDMEWDCTKPVSPPSPSPPASK